MKYNVIKIKREDLPDKLKNIKKPPKELYAIGNIDLLYEDSFGIVGTRKVTEYGIKNCKYFSSELVFRNIPIVSGMAIGTDTVAHKTALENRGKTIAIIGSGFNYIFPEENMKLFEEIVNKNGLVLTEYEENIKACKENFPKRNRIITAISEGILIIEAGYRSGTSITARNAREQGKKVFAVPGKIDSSVGIGVNRMIREGAILTTKIEDILEYYPQFEEKKRITEIENFKKAPIKKEYKQIANILKQKESYLEEILADTNLKLVELLEILTNMELEGIIKKENSGIFKFIG